MFNNISGIYGAFFKSQAANYAKIVETIKPKFDISRFQNALDVGCGTGALAKVLYEQGLEVTAVDHSRGMLKQAAKKLLDTSVKLLEIAEDEPLPFPDNTFDLVVSSYVAHGLKPEDRLILYEEMKRVARQYVVIHDYNQNRKFHVTFIEHLERSDYLYFIEVATEELESVFPEVRVIDVGPRSSWYICSIKAQI
ncbi:MAG: class I SAM-dependent methyltransferase [Eubacteriales bacterium]|nr:class I SAM-dependent methyltransferase [Eubacteriales bacterium]MDD4541402.1 class I SAM-dependent methyltransferase [Eubacteriales bacterium]